MWHIPYRKLTPMRTSVITNGNMITQYSMSMMTTACNISCQKYNPFKEENYSFFHKFHCPYFQDAYRIWRPVVTSLHQSFQHLLSPLTTTSLSIYRQNRSSTRQRGTRSRHKFPLYYLFTCTSCLYYKWHFIKPHAVQLLPWTAWTLQMGLIGCPKMLVWKCHLHSIKSRNSTDIKIIVQHSTFDIIQHTHLKTRLYIFSFNSSSGR